MKCTLEEIGFRRKDTPQVLLFNFSVRSSPVVDFEAQANPKVAEWMDLMLPSHSHLKEELLHAFSNLFWSSPKIGCITMMWGREGLYNEKVSSIYWKGTLSGISDKHIWHRCEFHCCLQISCERPWFWGTIERKGFPFRIANTALLCLLYAKFLFSIQTKNWLDENGLKAIVCILNKALSGILGALLHSFSFVFKAMFDGGNSSN